MTFPEWQAAGVGLSLVYDRGRCEVLDAAKTLCVTRHAMSMGWPWALSFADDAVAHSLRPPFPWSPSPRRPRAQGAPSTGQRSGRLPTGGHTHMDKVAVLRAPTWTWRTPSVAAARAQRKPRCPKDGFCRSLSRRASPGTFGAHGSIARLGGCGARGGGRWRRATALVGAYPAVLCEECAAVVADIAGRERERGRDVRELLEDERGDRPRRRASLRRERPQSDRPGERRPQAPGADCEGAAHDLRARRERPPPAPLIIASIRVATVAGPRSRACASNLKLKNLKRADSRD